MLLVVQHIFLTSKLFALCKHSINGDLSELFDITIKK